MKLKNIATLILAVVITLPTLAQRHNSPQHPAPNRSSYYTSSSSPKIDIIYGVAAGVSCPNLKISGNDAEVSSTPGFKAGIMWGVNWGTFELVPELWYSSFKMSFDSGASNVKGAEVRNKSIDFPIMFGIKIFDPIRINFGPTFSLLCNNELTTSNGDCYEFGRVKGSVGYMAGVSCDIYNNLFLDLRYVGRFSTNTTEYYGSSNSSDQYDIRMYSIDITAGFRF
ncbi:MAG: porin family protein [Rikenellaceae bacterium]